MPNISISHIVFIFPFCMLMFSLRYFHYELCIYGIGLHTYLTKISVFILTMF